MAAADWAGTSRHGPGDHKPTNTGGGRRGAGGHWPLNTRAQRFLMIDNSNKQRHLNLDYVNNVQVISVHYKSKSDRTDLTVNMAWPRTVGSARFGVNLFDDVFDIFRINIWIYSWFLYIRNIKFIGVTCKVITLSPIH